MSAPADQVTEAEVLLRSAEEFLFALQQLAARSMAPDRFERPDQVDFAFLMREISSTADAIRKLANQRLRHFSTHMGKDGMEENHRRINAGDLNAGKVVYRGRLASATPDAKVFGQVPKPGTPENKELLRYFGATEEMIERDFLRVSYDTLQMELTRLTQEGQEIPPGVGEKFTEFTVRLTKKRKKD